MFQHPPKILLVVFICGAQFAALAQTSETAPEKKEEAVVTMEKFVTDEKGSDALGLFTTKPSGVAFGFDKTLVETPRAITIISSQQMDSLGIHNTEDLVKAAPSTYTLFRFGLQGNLSIRNQSSDFYFRGMRRIDPQGNFSTRWGANDSLEIVRGPASPIFGLGRIGGYVNFNPKTARAASGKYLDAVTGDVKITYGSYDKKIASGEVSGPVKIFGKEGGYSVYGYYETGGSYRVNNRINQQELVQATFSVNLTQNLRAEAGTVLQYSYGGLDGGNNRTVTDTISTKTYWSGTSGKSPFSYQMDANGDGWISEKEIRDSYFGGIAQRSVTTNDPFRNSTTRTQIGPSQVYYPVTNDPFYRVIPWQGGPKNGGTITMEQFRAGYTDTAPTLVGGVATQRSGVQLMVYPTLLPNGSPDTSKTKVPFYLPYSYDLDPNYTWVKKKWNKQMSLGEDFYRANIAAYFLDFVNDYNPDQTYKNQIFIDGHHQAKVGSNGFSQRQQPLTLEDKATFTKKFNPTKWWSVNALASANMFMTWVNHTGNNSYDLDWRRDLQRIDSMEISSTFTSNDRFYNYVTSPNSYDYQPASQDQNSFYKVIGAGVMFDQTFFDKVDLITGYRYDYVDARFSVPTGVYERGSSSASSNIYNNTGLFGQIPVYAVGNSSKPSMSASLSYKAPFNLHPYVTAGQQAVIINNSSDGGLNTEAATRGNLTGTSTLLEAGLKGSMFKDKIFFSLSGYDQTRSSYDVLAGGGAGAVASTVSRGWEVELRFLLTKNLSLTSNGSWNKVVNLSSPGTVLINARDAGFPDVVDSTGKVVIPAEAFGWGGRLQTTIPSNVTKYNEVPGIPNHTISTTLAYNFTDGILKGFYISGTAYDQGSYAVNNLYTVKVPEAWVFDTNMGYRTKKWEVYAVVSNIFNRDVYAGGTGSPVGWLRPSFPQSVEVNYVRKF